MISKYTEQLFAEIYADAKVVPAEMIRLRERIDTAERELLEQEGLEGVIEATCKSFDVTRQLLQESLLRIRGGDYTTHGQALLMSVLEANVGFLQATFDAFSNSRNESR
jgi:hypothetical protein